MQGITKFSLFTAFIVTVSLWVFGSCATVAEEVPPPLTSCDAFLESSVKQKVEQGGLLVMQSGAELTSNGVTVFISLLDPQTRDVIAIVAVDTASLVAEVATHGLLKIGTCDRGGHVWTVMSGVIGKAPELPEA